jgi:DNA topoisomerase IB/8-oxo-dGTP pyrophosphatase MutT (NUDIX family)
MSQHRAASVADRAIAAALIAQDGEHDALAQILAEAAAYEHWWEATSPAQDADFKEEDHPRAPDGKFGSGGGGAAPKAASESFGAKGKKPPASLGGVPFKSWKPPTSQQGWEDAAKAGPKFDEPKPAKAGTLKDNRGKTYEKHRGAGVIIMEDDGRVWVMHPTDGYGGYKGTFPKGTVDEGMSLRATALKEAYEETGLKVELTGYAGDVERDTSMARYYFAKRTGGTPEDHGPEAERVTLAPPEDLHHHLNRTIDRLMVQDILGVTLPTPKKAALSKAAPSFAKAQASAPTPAGALKLSGMKKIGGQLGSNPGGKYQDDAGTAYYAKQSKSNDHAKNEVLAARLYEAAGSPILPALLADMGNGKLGTATKWADATNINLSDATDRKDAHDHFATHAWLANWDAVGLGQHQNDWNQARVNGAMTTLDPGGSLLYRAQGGPKGSAFGTAVGEWDTMRDKKNAHGLYTDMTPAQLKASAAKVTGVTNATIQKLVEEHGPGDAKARTALADKLIARRDDIAKRVASLGQDAFEESKHPRGQPENAGEFAKGQGGGGGAAQAPARPGRGKARPDMVPLDRSKPLPPHLAKLAIPPAWTDVRVTTNPKAALLVSGRDAKGRPTAVYSEAHHAKQAAAKFARIAELTAKFEKIRAQNEQARQDPARRNVADALAVVMAMGIRPGSERDTGAEKQAYGATTIEGRHVHVEHGKVSLVFTGKKGVALNLPVDDPTLAKMLVQRKQAAGATGKVFGGISNDDLLAHSHSMDGGGFKSKDFRTHLGTKTAATLVAARPRPTDAKSYRAAVMDVAKHVSAKLGNTPAIALQSYIAPEVFAPWRIAG